ncbi:MAG TPA: hypothetical protein VD767_02250 [Thermomicrobiales bacterium]|nr:hypothetical protein [Thermomicrobiales bacterium]
MTLAEVISIDLRPLVGFVALFSFGLAAALARRRASMESDLIESLSNGNPRIGSARVPGRDSYS